MLRAYRAVEMMGQARLYTHGLDSADLNQDNAGVQAWLRDKKKEKKPIPPAEHGVIAIGRENTASLLIHLGDVYGNKLLDADQYKSLKPRVRNKSLLIHGFTAQTAGIDEQRLRDTLTRLELLFVEDGPEPNTARLAAARFPFGGG